MVEAARPRLSGVVLRTPLVSLNLEDAPAEIFLKLENLQPTGSFKVRGAGNAIALIPEVERAKGVYTCSAGNMAQALAWHARRRRIPCAVVVPDNASEPKIEGIRRYGARIVQVPWDEVWRVVKTRRYGPLDHMTFVHPFADPQMIAGNGTIGLEILEDLPEVDSVIVPFGGGGLISGVATAIRARKPGCRVYACEPETAAPLAKSFAEGGPREIHRIPSFVDGIGASSVLPEMWPLLSRLVERSIVVSLQQIASAVKLLAERNRLVAEGAGAASVAAALSGRAGGGRIVCVVSGGNLSIPALVKILGGEIP